MSAVLMDGVWTIGTGHLSRTSLRTKSCDGAVVCGWQLARSGSKLTTLAARVAIMKQSRRMVVASEADDILVGSDT